ncbi:hypothetical protein HYDPIDRAFT_86964 [Hydnomerulius pinastri MD-312]|nr:hypothetical protein HYDPIDRAFT_86964 [Hydnomerulius pinastri MD-312]
MSSIPPLPTIDGDLLLDVFSRQSSRTPMTLPDNSEYGGAERLAELGGSILNMVVMYSLFFRQPHLPASELSEKHEQLLDDGHIAQWLAVYSLKNKVRNVENPQILDQPEESRRLFNSYVGAVYVQKGLPVVLDWISRLLNPEVEPPQAPGSTPASNIPLPQSPPPYSSSSASVTPVPPSAPPPPMPGTPTGNTPSVNALALFNQTCSQRGLIINWESESEGPPHQPRWQVKCLGECLHSPLLCRVLIGLPVNGVLKGTGNGRNQKVAKEEAARQAFQAMGWGSKQLFRLRCLRCRAHFSRRVLMAAHSTN